MKALPMAAAIFWLAALGLAGQDAGEAFSEEESSLRWSIDATVAALASATGGEGFSFADAATSLAFGIEPSLYLTYAWMRLSVELEAIAMSGALAARAALMPEAALPGYFVAPDGSFAFKASTVSLRLGSNPRLVVGRQIVNLGSGTAWSPADAFSAVSMAGGEQTRSSVDAIRLTVFSGPTDGAEALWLPGADLGSSRVALRLFLAPWGVDMAALASYDAGAEAWTFAFDAKADAEIVGVWVDGAAAWSVADGAWAFETVVGFDASLGDFVATAEWRWSSESAEPGSAEALSMRFPAEHYLFAAMTLPIGDEWSLMATGTWDPVNMIDSETIACSYWMGATLELTVALSSVGGSFAAGPSERTWALAIGLAASF
jgi:hypothetical protein